jgi:AcrR family transcriptional regulator
LERTHLRRSQEERRAETRRMLLDATIEVLFEEGYRKCSLAVVAKRAGLTTGALQHHFESRTKLFRAVIKERLSKFDSVERVSTLAKASVSQRCKSVVDQSWQFYGNPKYVALWEIILGARADPELQQDIQGWQKRSIAISEGFLSDIFHDLSLKASDLKSIQYFVNAHLRGLALLGTVENTPRVVSTQKKLLVQMLELHIARLAQ